MVAMFFRRAFRPAAMALAIAALFLGFTWSVQDRIDGPFDNVMAGCAIGVALILFAAWWYDSDRARRFGFILSVWLWSAVSSIAFMELIGWTSGLLSLAWAFLAAGSYWAEVDDERRA